jgi:hypothetical protein
VVTGVLIASHVTVLLVGLILGAARVHRSKSRWVLAGQHQAELTHGEWHPVVVDGWNRQELPQRRRSPDHQLVEPEVPIQRPGFYDQPR